MALLQTQGRQGHYREGLCTVLIGPEHSGRGLAEQREWTEGHHDVMCQSPTRGQGGASCGSVEGMGMRGWGHTWKASRTMWSVTDYTWRGHKGLRLMLGEGDLTCGVPGEHSEAAPPPLTPGTLGAALVGRVGVSSTGSKGWAPGFLFLLNQAVPCL